MVALQVVPPTPPREPHQNKGHCDNFQEAVKEVNFIFGGPDVPHSKRKQKLEYHEYLRWSEVPITFDQSDHPEHISKPGRYPLVLPQLSTRSY